MKFLIIIFLFLSQITALSFEGDSEEIGPKRSVVGIYEGGELLCTGVVLDRDTIITAKHCLSHVVSTKKLSGLVIAGRMGARALGILEHHRLDISLVKTTRLKQDKGFSGIWASSLESGAEVIIGGINVMEGVVLAETRVRVSSGSLSEIEEGPVYLCHGDSGAPVFVKQNDNYFLAGIVLRGEEGCYGKGIFLNLKEVF